MKDILPYKIGTLLKTVEPGKTQYGKVHHYIVGTKIQVVLELCYETEPTLTEPIDIEKLSEKWSNFKIRGSQIRYNSMANEMSERYAEYFHTSNLEERIAKQILFWVMSTLESIFWGFDRRSPYVRLYANHKEIVLLAENPITGRKPELEFVYYTIRYYETEKLLIILKTFVEMFNNIKYPLSTRLKKSPYFSASLLNDDEPIQESEAKKYEGYEKYIGYYEIGVSINMRPLSDDDYRR